MRKMLALALALIMVLSCVGCGSKAADDSAPKKIGFVTMGLGNDFFQTLADEFVKQFEEAGWEASYADGSFDPTKQIEAVENYVAMGVDALVIWPVAPAAMTGAIQTAMAQGIKVVSFVNRTDDYDAMMGTDDVKLADDCCRLAAMWIDEHYADAADGSVDVAVFAVRADDTGEVQANEMMKVADYSTKIGNVIEVACPEESTAAGQEKMENLYTTNPEIKVFLTPHSPIALGANSFFTGISSPVSDYSDYGIFCVNGTQALDQIGASVNNGSPFRGTVMTGNEADTAHDMFVVVTGLMDGTYEKGYEQVAATVFAYGSPVAGEMVITVGELPQN